MRFLPVIIILLFTYGCTPGSVKENTDETASTIHVAGAMRNVMRKGELAATIRLDTISNRTGLYGLGPAGNLRGELLINGGKAYRSVVTSDSTMAVEATYTAEAPFFVYGNATEWETSELPADVKASADLEAYISKQAKSYAGPFVFKLTGRAESALIHVQNLPEGSKVSSPAEAHQGQVKYTLTDRDVEIVGFFSKNHQGVFTHHDVFTHLHLITMDETMMGHLDDLVIGSMQLQLPSR